MFEVGRIHALQVDHVDERGAWLLGGGEAILLPRREVSGEIKAGERLSVFVTRESSGSLVATLRRPLAQLGEFALLRVRQVSRPGAFLDWGLEKDLLVPYSEQPERMQVGRNYLVKVCLDSLGRLVGTARIDRCLEKEEIDLAEGEKVELVIWEFTDLGARVIINDLYAGLLYKDELKGGLKRGDRLKGYVKRLREDRKVDVTLSRGGAEGMEEAKAVLLAALRQSDFLPLHDQSPPAVIQQVLGISKKTFKKAVGGLYKAGLVELGSEGIRLKKG
ncbi:MAG TPA: S1-like domain-containing RNA-binding protein [Desulfuromonadales bacterium]|nr:S1-like domain-containing RNA-binding protein [Desulfuromonadales bacterium]